MRIFLRKTVFPAIYRFQTIFGIKPQGVSLITGCPRSGTSAVLWWLSEQNRVEGSYESRILISIHRFLVEVEKFIILQENREFLISMNRRLFYSYHAKSRFLWNKVLVEKEPLEPIAFPHWHYDEFLHHVQIIIPDIKLLFVVREPVETIWSMCQREWGESLTTQALRSYSLDECIRIWNSNAAIVLKYASAPNVYVCKFDRLVSDPFNESKRIFKFLSIPGTKIFTPKPTKTVSFSRKDREIILHKTLQSRESLFSV